MKKLISLIFLIVVVCTAVAAYLWINPPLVIGAIYSELDEKSVILSVGNDGFREIQIDQVLVNERVEPSAVVMQVSNAIEGYSLSSGFKDGATIKKIEKAKIPTGSDPIAIYEKLDDRTATADDLVYGIEIVHDQAIKTVIIHYRYFWLPLKKKMNLEI